MMQKQNSSFLHTKKYLFRQKTKQSPITAKSLSSPHEETVYNNSVSFLQKQLQKSKDFQAIKNVKTYLQESYIYQTAQKMKNQLLKKFQGSSQTQEKLDYLQSKTYERSQYNSLNKYNRSPYLQSNISVKKSEVANQMQGRRKSPIPEGDSKTEDELTLNSFKRKNEHDNNAAQMRSFSNSSNYQLPKVTNTLSPAKKSTMFKLPRIDHEQASIFQKQTAQSATLQLSSTKKKRLEPLRHQAFKCITKTKAGTNGKQLKINQDCAFVDQKLPFGLKCFCVCDGHGLNGHIVSSFIKIHMLKNLTSTLRKVSVQPSYQKMQDIIYNIFNRTNEQLLQSDINTQLSGSTVVAVFEYKNRLFCFNVGDSRAILCYQVPNNTRDNIQEDEMTRPQLQLLSQKFSNKKPLKQNHNPLMKYNLSLSKSNQFDKFSWKIRELSSDQKPEREDQKERVLKNGGRIECNRTEKGEEIGPLRVWMKDIQMPGLAMTRSFGDKAGIKAGTNGEPEIIQHEITEEDKFIVIASDGVWEYLQNQEITNVIVPFYLRDDIDMAAQKVVKLSTDVWGRVSYSRDDISVIIVGLNAPRS